jgi:transcriptional regulator with XRE-family HTH domain
MPKNEDRLALGQRLKNTREYRGFSQEDVATCLGIPRSAVSLIETGDRKLDTLELSKLAKLFDCSTDELTGDRESQGDNSASIEFVARLAAKLSEEDRAEVVRFAQFLAARKPREQ